VTAFHRLYESLRSRLYQLMGYVPVTWHTEWHPTRSVGDADTPIRDLTDRRKW
jgi:hypothetical protein